MTRRQILYLAHRIPYPPDKGDKIRTWNTLEHLTHRFDVHLAAFVDDQADFQHEAHLKGVCASVSLVGLNRISAALRSVSGFLTGEPLTTAFYRDARMIRAVKAARRNNLVAEIGFSSSMAHYLLSGGGSARKIIDLCDADSAKWTAYGHVRRGLTRGVYAREGRLLAMEETRIINAADAAFAISEEEADLLGQRAGVQREVFYFGNGVDTDFFAPGASFAPVDGTDVVFVGAMDYWANVDAVLWFVRDVWPSIRAAHPEAKFGIVGARPSADMLALDGVDGITVTGRVEDVRPYLEAARLVVAPMRIARGVQNKVLEAMAMGKAVVSTPAGLEGIDAVIGYEAIAAASPETFAREVIRLIDDVQAAQAIGSAARKRVLDDYQWPAQLAKLDAALDRLIGVA